MGADLQRVITYDFGCPVVGLSTAARTVVLPDGSAIIAALVGGIGASPASPETIGVIATVDPNGRVTSRHTSYPPKVWGTSAATGSQAGVFANSDHFSVVDRWGEVVTTVPWSLVLSAGGVGAKDNAGVRNAYSLASESSAIVFYGTSESVGPEPPQRDLIAIEVASSGDWTLRASLSNLVSHVYQPVLGGDSQVYGLGDGGSEESVVGNGAAPCKAGFGDKDIFRLLPTDTGDFYAIGSMGWSWNIHGFSGLTVALLGPGCKVVWERDYPNWSMQPSTDALSLRDGGILLVHATGDRIEFIELTAAGDLVSSGSFDAPVSLFPTSAIFLSHGDGGGIEDGGVVLTGQVLQYTPTCDDCWPSPPEPTLHWIARLGGHRCGFKE